MLMMLALGWLHVKRRAADAHDAGLVMMLALGRF